jgi:hypothetical protein
VETAKAATRAAQKAAEEAASKNLREGLTLARRAA